MKYETATLALLRIRGLGPKAVVSFWGTCTEPATPEELHGMLGSGAIERLKIRPSLGEIEACWRRASEIIASCEAEGITILGRENPLPDMVRRIPDPPLILFAKGNPKALNGRGIAVIGTREPSEYGMKSAKRIAAVLAEKGRVVVSGLAVGCDTAGHEGCLNAGGITVAVLAHGFGRIYPASNRDLADSILDSSGCLVSEYPPGQPPTRSSFIDRDRIQSGLSEAILVIETDIKGGTMHTVRHAETQGRGIAALAHPPDLLDHPKTRGNQMLIKESRAVPIGNKDDLYCFIDALGAGRNDTFQSQGNIQMKLDF